jgi:hypothetical protein
VIKAPRLSIKVASMDGTREVCDVPQDGLVKDVKTGLAEMCPTGPGGTSSRIQLFVSGAEAALPDKQPVATIPFPDASDPELFVCQLSYPTNWTLQQLYSELKGLDRTQAAEAKVLTELIEVRYTAMRSESDGKTCQLCNKEDDFLQNCSGACELLVCSECSVDTTIHESEDSDYDSDYGYRRGGGEEKSCCLSCYTSACEHNNGPDCQQGCFLRTIISEGKDSGMIWIRNPDHKKKKQNRHHPRGTLRSWIDTKTKQNRGGWYREVSVQAGCIRYRRLQELSERATEPARAAAAARKAKEEAEESEIWLKSEAGQLQLRQQALEKAESELAMNAFLDDLSHRHCLRE